MPGYCVEGLPEVIAVRSILEAGFTASRPSRTACVMCVKSGMVIFETALSEIEWDTWCYLCSVE